jgi:uncharacterized membrane protein
MTTTAVDAYVPMVALSAVSGARTMLGIAALAQARARAANHRAIADQARPAIPRAISRVSGEFDRRIAVGATLLALGEMVADKSPDTGDRIDAGPIIGRCIAGAIVGAGVAQFSGKDRKMSAVIGAVTAFAAAHASFRARRALDDVLPDFLGGVVEDLAVSAIAVGAMALLVPPIVVIPQE